MRPRRLARRLQEGVSRPGPAGHLARIERSPACPPARQDPRSTTAKAHQEIALAMTLRAQGQSARIGVAQSADLDATIASPQSCATRVVDGTFEAKRVWTELPAQARDEPELEDRGVKLTWTGCGQATAQFAAD
jgi:hypothetical protein